MKKKKPAARLPGTRKPKDTIARMIRVDHAGEFGAQRIYAGQLAVYWATVRPRPPFARWPGRKTNISPLSRN